MSSGLRPRRRPARLQRRRRSAAPGSDGQARESTTRTQDAAINDPTCAVFVESYAPGRGIGLFIHGVFCQVVLNKWDCGGNLGPKQSTGPWAQEDPSCPGLRARSHHVKARELRDRLAGPAGPRGGGSVTGTLARVDCLAVDEIGRRASGKERAGPPLRVVERRCEHEGPTLPRVLDGATLFVARGARPPQCGLEDLCGGDGARGGQDPPSWASRRLGREDKDSEIDDSGVLAILT